MTQMRLNLNDANESQFKWREWVSIEMTRMRLNLNDANESQEAVNNGNMYAYAGIARLNNHQPGVDFVN
jgi:phosphotransferase system IIB component